MAVFLVAPKKPRNDLNFYILICYSATKFFFHHLNYCKFLTELEHFYHSFIVK